MGTGQARLPGRGRPGIGWTGRTHGLRHEPQRATATKQAANFLLTWVPGKPRPRFQVRPVPPEAAQTYRRAMAQMLDIEEFLEEVSRYLRAVDAFREESREPIWLAEEEELACARS